MGWIIDKILLGIVWIGITILRGFLGYIDICNAVLTTFLIVVFMNVDYGWSNRWALALGLSVSLVVYIIFKHHIGFWIVATAYSALWSWMLVDSAKCFWVKDMSDMWYWIWMIAIGAFALWLHTEARDRKEVDEQIAAEEAAKKWVQSENYTPMGPTYLDYETCTLQPISQKPENYGTPEYMENATRLYHERKNIK